MNKEQIQEMIDESIAKQANTNQYSVSQVPLHVHNGLDSNVVPAQFNDYTNFAVWGTATADGSGQITITNRNILSTSVILVTGTQNDAFTIDAVCTVGTGLITNAASGELVNYLIIFNPTQ